jgi:hypothetical protein
MAELLKISPQVINLGVIGIILTTNKEEHFWNRRNFCSPRSVALTRLFMRHSFWYKSGHYPPKLAHFLTTFVRCIQFAARVS